MSIEQLLWAVGSLCALHRLPFDQALLLKALPTPGTVGTLIHALRAMGLRATWEPMPLQQALQTGGVPTLALTIGPHVPLVLLGPAPAGGEADSLQAEVWVRNEDIGFVHPGQAVQVKLAAYPFQKYGLLAGEVIHLGPDATDAPAAASPEGVGAGAATSPRYRALVRLKGQQRNPALDALPLTAGMQVTVDILLGERSVLNYLLSPLQRAWHEAARER